ncbi:MAG: N-acetylneuraminate synthase family protein [Deltaproteobacteria bacterium]|nr:N-acetylneuraminate synthase family protein [Deltaproteobacteria bacterium]
MNIFNSEKTFIIAEIGSNHNQSLNTAYQTIDAAKEAGADAVKFQSINMEELYLKPSDTIKKLFKQIELNEKWHYDLKKYCDKKEIIFFSSPTYLKAIDILEDINVKLYKLASAQVGTFPQLIKKTALTGKPALLSTGIVSFAQLQRAVNIFKSAQNEKFTILHCNSIYPVPYHKINLKLLKIYKSMFNKPVGFSDHTDNIYISLAAVEIGASVIERHFILDKKIDTPDKKISLEPRLFQNMVKGIRAIEQSGKFYDRTVIDDEENLFKQSIRYKIILAKDKQKDESFYETDFVFKRHNKGIDCIDADFLINNFNAGQSLKKNRLLTWDKVSGKK